MQRLITMMQRRYAWLFSGLWNIMKAYKSSDFSGREQNILTCGKKLETSRPCDSKAMRRFMPSTFSASNLLSSKTAMFPSSGSSYRYASVPTLLINAVARVSEAAVFANCGNMMANSDDSHKNNSPRLQIPHINFISPGLSSSVSRSASCPYPPAERKSPPNSKYCPTIHLHHYFHSCHIFIILESG